MLNVFPVDESYRDCFMKKLDESKISEAESEVYSRYDINIEEKAKQDASIIRNMMVEAEAIALAIVDIESRHENLMNKIDKAKYDLKAMLEINSINSIKTPYIEVKISKNPHSTNVYSEADIPHEYIKETLVKTINKKQILDDLKQGVIIPGCELQQKTRIDIK